MSVVDLEQIRGQKKDKCEYCGEEEHEAIFACPRVKSITYDNENDTVTVRLWSEIALAGGREL